MSRKYTKNWKEKLCVICKKLFKPTSGKSQTCSKECSYKRKRIYDKQYMQQHPEQMAKWNRESIRRNKDKVNERARKRYQRDRKIIKVRNETNQFLRKLGLKKYGGCMDCHQIGNLEIHHITYTKDDFVLICKKCHHKRHGKTLYSL